MGLSLENNIKWCYDCKQEKSILDFFKNKRHKDGLSSQCKICKNKYSSEYRLKNLKLFSEYSKKWRETHERNKEYYDVYNKKYHQEVTKSKRKERLKTDIFYKLKVTLRSRTYLAFKVKNWKKTSPYYDILGADYETIKLYLENKFTEGMSWENHGLWHIDHIIPIKSANNEKELYDICHYTNLQPLWAEDNLKKSAKLL